MKQAEATTGLAGAEALASRVNQIHHANFLSNDLPDKSVQLIIADPPYFEVKGDFDFVWESRDAYLADVELWAKECKRVMADNGTLFWWGMDRKIAYSQIVLDKYFPLLNTLVWERPGLSSEWDTMRTFPARAMERVLMYGAVQDDIGLLGKTGLEQIKDNPELFAEIKAYLRDERKASGLPMSWFVEQSSTYANHYFAVTSQWAFPTERDYVSFQKSGRFQRPYEALRAEYEALRAEYEALRAEYEALRRPFNNEAKLWDVLHFPQDNPSAAAGHPTPKPMKLTRALILATSRPGDIVLAPFAGSGTECAMAAREGRRFIGYEIDPKHVETARKRVAKELAMPRMF